MYTIDPMLRPKINRCNPGSPKLLGIVEKRCIDFEKRFKGVTVNPHIKNLAARMDKKHKEDFGYDYLMFHHQPMNHAMALMCQRYGMNEKQWPDQFTPEDLDRLIVWESGAKVPDRVVRGFKTYLFPPIAGGSEFSDYQEAEVGNGLFRSGLTSPPSRLDSNAYILGDRVRLATWDDTIYRCVVAGTTAASAPGFSTTLGAETVDGTATWQAEKIGPLKTGLWFALYTASPGETGGGTEVSGGNYARVPLHPNDTNWTASTQVGGSGRNDNAIAIQYGAPSANWGVITDTSFLDRASTGNFLMSTPLDLAKTVNNGDTAPSFPIGAFNVDIA